MTTMIVLWTAIGLLPLWIFIGLWIGHANHERNERRRKAKNRAVCNASVEAMYRQMNKKYGDD